MRNYMYKLIPHVRIKSFKAPLAPLRESQYNNNYYSQLERIFEIINLRYTQRASSRLQMQDLNELNISFDLCDVLFTLAINQKIIMRSTDFIKTNLEIHT